MKPLYLEIQAFGPYVECQKIDFEKLGRNGIFLIKGITGSGKTTIFDAMTFALYGGGSGESERVRNGRNDLEEWRCTQANRNLDTRVSFEFSVRDHKYRFTRSLIQRRVNLAAQYEAGEIDDNGDFIPFFDNPRKDDLNKKAQELIGLTKEQFRQVILLPQGQFERFLTASSSDKQEILQKIFSSEMWSQYAKNFYEEANKRKGILDEELNKINISLADESMSELEDLESLINTSKDEIKECEAYHSAYGGEAKQNKLNADIELAQQFKPLHDLELELLELNGKRNEIEVKRTAYNEAEKAEQVRIPLSVFEKAEKDCIDRQKKLRELQANKPRLEVVKSAAEKARKDHDDNSPVNELNKKIGIYETKEAFYHSIDSLKKAFDGKKKELSKAEMNFKVAEDNLSEKNSIAINKKSIFDKASGDAKNYRDRYYAGIYGEIASELEEGNKCPICGSTSHPSPAVKLPNSISKAELDVKEAAAELAKKEWDEAEESRRLADDQRNNRKSELSRIESEYKVSESDYNNASANLIIGIPDANALNMAIQEAKARITTYNEEGDVLQKKLNKASEELTTLLGNISAAENEMKTAISDKESKLLLMENALKSAGYSDSSEASKYLLDVNDRKLLHEIIVKYDSSVIRVNEDIKDMQQKLAGKTEPDRTKFTARQSEISSELAEYNTKHSKLNSLVDRLEKKYGELAKLKKHYDDNIQQADSDLAFAKKLRGDTGIGIQRYVLAIMFNQVIGEANRMLAKVHGGRYHLYRTDEKGTGNQRGLELKVHDNRSPEKEGRSVAMLSGGEKFLVSLSLSIGMSTVARNSGVQIESLFIDEGFGTLDNESIQDALDVLEAVRKGTGTIGIISHVQLLEDNIPMHLEVIKEDSGSRIAIN